jgi:hypothetical protein
MTMKNSTGLGESGYRPQKPYKEPRVYTVERVCIQWDDYEIGRKAKMIAHICAESQVGADVLEHERKFGYAYCTFALYVCVKRIPGFVDWYVEQSKGEDPYTFDTQRGIPRGAYRLYQRVYNAYLNPKGRKEDGTRASRSREHYMHPSKAFLRQWKEWAVAQVQAVHRFRVRSKTPRNEFIRGPYA